MKVACPFCKPNDTAKRGEGCCNCDYEGIVPIGETFAFKTEEEAINHNSEISYIDLRINRAQKRDLNYKPW